MRIGAPFNVNQCEITKLLPITNYQNLDQYKVMKNLQKDGIVSTLLHVD